MKNLTIKDTCACGKEVTEKDIDPQADIHAVLAMLEGRVAHEKIVNYIRAYMLDKGKVV